MSRYRIVNLILEADEVPPCFESFFYRGKRPPDMRAAYLPRAAMKKAFQILAEVSGLRIGICGNEWIYEDCASGCRMHVNRDYSGAVLSEEVKDNTVLWGFLLQLFLECRLLDEGAITLHSCCIEYTDHAYAFSGPSGCGKSTRARQWIEELGARYISGDRPVIDIGKMAAHGAPWDGKERVFQNTGADLAAVMEVRRAGFTGIRCLSAKQGRDFLMKQIFIPMWDSDRAMEAMVLLSRFLTKTSVFRLFCDQDAAAAKETRSILFDHREKIRKESEDMRLNEGFVLKSMAGEYVIMPVGSNIAAFDGMVILNEVSAFIIKQLEKGDISREDLLELVLDEYEVDRETAKADLDELSDKLLGIGVITIN